MIDDDDLSTKLMLLHMVGWQTQQHANTTVVILSMLIGAVVFCFCFFVSLLLSSSTRRRFYPQRSSGQAVVTGVVPSPPRYGPSFLSLIGFSIPTARRFSSNVAHLRSRAFR